MFKGRADWRSVGARLRHRPLASLISTRRAVSGISELLEATQLGKNQQGVLDSVKEYYGEVCDLADTHAAFSLAAPPVRYRPACFPPWPRRC